ncbi:hypothetical protein GXW74_15770 [Roseomonas eburnea]|uniref:Uncharacterized protein n=1 Tax=Neoroseomonas eburnea TaxID=1346889 RepID=A0A9X9XE17_9PROT|nr:hypothetical protein [Neoroseomonas eburnea]MBR0681953.1 hypothetical protein [Neoroseomonas eburnea]
MPRRPRAPRVTLSTLFGGAFFAALIVGWFWVGQLVAVGAGWHPLAEAGRQIAQAVRP